MGELTHILIILLTAPIWVPIARALWTELNEGLASEGGLFGSGQARTSSRAEGMGWQSRPIVHPAQRLGRGQSPAGARRPGRRRLPSTRWH